MKSKKRTYRANFTKIKTKEHQCVIEKYKK